MDLEVLVLLNGSLLNLSLIKYYIIAGEASGDIYGSELISALKANDPDASFRFWGGEKMRAVDSNQAMDYKHTAFMGFWEVIKNIGSIRKHFAFCKKDIESFQPDRIIYIDYPGFNMRMADWSNKKGFHNIYFVAPQIWAWKKNRYKKIKRDIKQLYVILPFEKGFYKGLGIEADYFGHPLEANIQQKTVQEFNTDALKIAILPGSRKQELEKHLPVFSELIRSRPQDHFTIAIAPGLSKEDIVPYLPKLNNLSFDNNNHNVIKEADIAIIKSGTSTLETALIGTPQIVIYKTSSLSYSIAKRIVKLPYISLVNIIAGKEIVKELIQDDFNLNNINHEIEKLLIQKNFDSMIQSYTELRSSLKGDQVYTAIAKSILNFDQPIL